MPDFQYYSNFIWDIADLLRGPYRPPQYERVMLPLIVLRRFDCLLLDNKEKVVNEFNARKAKYKGQEDILDPILNKLAGKDKETGQYFRFHNHSALTFEKLKGDPDSINQQLASYINSFSKNVRDIFEKFEFSKEIEYMHEANILFLIISKFCDIDLHPGTTENPNVTNALMGDIFEDLIRRFNEQANETAGDHFTPREAIQLMVDLLFSPDDDILTVPNKVFKLFDPTCGTGGMLSEAQNHLRDMHADGKLWVFGQDVNPRSYAVAHSDLLIKGNANSDVRFGDSLINDQFKNERFDYFLANPPFGVDWKRQKSEIESEYNKQGFAGRFGAGLPRVNDGSLLFLQHMIHKFVPYQPKEKDSTGSRLAIVLNGSPLFTGGAGSGESEIRKWIIENDWLETIVALPNDMFYNTGIGTYIWVLSNRKQKNRKGKIQLIDARERWKPMRRSLGNKRRYLGEDDIVSIVKEYGGFRETDTSKIFDNEDFGYNRVPIERPLRLLYQMDVERKSLFLDAVPHLLDDVQAIDKELGREPRDNWTAFDALMSDLLKRRSSKWKATEKKLFRDVFAEKNVDAAPVVLKERKPAKEKDARVWGWFYDEKSKTEQMYEPDTQLRDNENIRLKEDIADYFLREVEPHVSDAWADKEKIVSAYEINFNRYFYTYQAPRPLADIDADIKSMEEEIVRLLREVTA